MQTRALVYYDTLLLSANGLEWRKTSAKVLLHAYRELRCECGKLLGADMLIAAGRIRCPRCRRDTVIRADGTPATEGEKIPVDAPGQICDNVPAKSKTGQHAPVNRDAPMK